MNNFFIQKKNVNLIKTIDDSNFYLAIYIMICVILYAFSQFDLLKIIFLIGAVSIALYKLHKRPHLYLSWIVILFIGSPIIRRLIDWKAGFDSNSLIILTPSIAALICLIEIIRKIDRFNKISSMPYVLALLGVVYGFAIGLFTNGLYAAVYDFVLWSGPLFLALYASQLTYSVKNFSILAKTLAYSAMIMGIYGIYQYIAAPPWDTAWLVNSGLFSEGRPLPYAIRVWSTMNSSGIYAVYAMAGIILAQTVKKSLIPAVYIFGIIGLALSLVRTAWIGLVIGIIIFIVSQNAVRMFKSIIYLLIFGGISFSILYNTPFYTKVSERFSSLGNLSTDVSFQSRQDAYSSEIDRALFNVVGDGLGGTGLASKLSERKGFKGLGGSDSGLLNTLNSLGWLGTLLYILGLVLGLYLAIPRKKAHPLATAFFCVSLVCVLQLTAYSSNISVQGYIMWLPLAIAVYLKKNFFITKKVLR